MTESLHLPPKCASIWVVYRKLLFFLAFMALLLYITPMRLLGIDYGTKRVGLALSDEAGAFAYPHSVIRNDRNLIKNVKDICEKEGVGKIVLGESLDYKNNPNEIMTEINIFKRNIEGFVKLPVKFEVETLTSAEAERIQGKVEKLDASAAAIILENYIHRNKRSK